MSSYARSIALVFLVSACGGAPAPTPVEVVAPAPVSVAVGETPPTPDVPAAVEVAEGGPIRVAECDRYLDTYLRCVATMAEEEQASHRAVIEGQRAAWARTSRDEALAPALTEACEAATNAARVALPQCRGW